MSIIEKYELGGAIAQLTSDPGATLTAIHEVIVDLCGKVAAIEAAEKSAPKIETVNPLAEKYGKDEDGKAAAEKFLREQGGVFDLVVAYIGNDPAKTFHVKNAVSGLLGLFLSNEVSFHSAKEAAPKAPKSSAKGELKADVNALRKQIAFVAGFVIGGGFDPTTVPNILVSDDGKVWESAIDGFRGAKSVDDGSVTGRYAKVYGLSWIIDGKEVKYDQIADITRLIWTGADRIGKNAKSLTDVLDSKTKWMETDFTSATFTVNGHKINVSRTVTE